MRLATALFALAALAIVAFWGWLGAAVEMPQSPLAAGEPAPSIQLDDLIREIARTLARERGPAERR